MKRFFIICAVPLFFALSATAIVAGLTAYWFSAPGPLGQEKTVDIPPGTGFTAITDRLVSEGAIAYALPFKALVFWHGQQGAFKAGEYKILPASSPRQIMDMLVKGESIIHALTIPEGLNAREITALLLAEDLLTGTLPEKIEEGSLMPETYYYHRGDSRESVLKRMQQMMRESLEAAWAKRANGLPLNTPQEALTLAAIVEKETGVTDERGRVASVFINRLRRSMPLQSDPTVVYGIEKQDGAMTHALTRNDLARDHPYNTYLHAGLPPGPICSPGKAAIEAVMHPPATDDLYFVATGTGGHHFASSLQEHNANVARYRAQLRMQK